VLENWDGIFDEVFAEREEFSQRLEDLRRYRNPDAHRRSLLPFEVHLARGAAGFLRAGIARYRSSRQLPEDYFPRLEHVRDSAGNAWTPSQNKYALVTSTVLRVGDVLEIIASAQDPLDGPLRYRFTKSTRKQGELLSWSTGWTTERQVRVQIEREDISLRFGVTVEIQSERDYHAWAERDDVLEVVYKVVPRAAEATAARDHKRTSVGRGGR
jgi:hypothetical protein